MKKKFILSSLIGFLLLSLSCSNGNNSIGTNEENGKITITIKNPFYHSKIEAEKYIFYALDMRVEDKTNNSFMIHDSNYDISDSISSVEFKKNDSYDTKTIQLTREDSYVFALCAYDNSNHSINSIFNPYYDMKYNIPYYTLACFKERNLSQKFRQSIQPDRLENSIYTYWDFSISELVYSDERESFWQISENTIIAFPFVGGIKILEKDESTLYNPKENPQETQLFYYYSTSIDNNDEIITIHILSNVTDTTTLNNQTEIGLIKFNKTKKKLFYCKYDEIEVNETDIQEMQENFNYEIHEYVYSTK